MTDLLFRTYDPQEREWDEAKHPREPGGSSEGGQFTSGGGGDGGGGGEEKPSGGHPGKGYSKDAKVINGVIHTSNVYDAARALYEGKKVNLTQKRSVSTLIAHLGRISQRMIASGGKAPTFNLCDVTVEGSNLFCVESKGIPRISM